jgi:hypothetical protein
VGRKQRVRLGLAQVHRRRGALVLRPAIAIAVLVGFGAVASAALGRWPALVSDAYRRLVGAPAASGPPRVVAARRVRAGGARAPAPASAPAPDEAASTAAAAGLAAAPPLAVQPPSPPAPAPPAARALRRAMSESARGVAPGPARDAAGAPRARRPAAPRTGDDTAPVIQAMRALRVEGNPVRARALLERYLDRYPQGTLAEEALAMSIEAANVHRDGDAVTLARRYLKLYPAGHFSTLARQTLSGSAPARN